MSITEARQLSFKSILALEDYESTSFANQLQQDEDFYFHLTALLIALPLQLKRFEELYIYDEIKYGNLFAELYEKQTKLKLDQAIDLVKTLAQYSYYREERLSLHKTCTGHKDYAKTTILAANFEKEKSKIIAEWSQKKEIMKFEVLKEVAPTLIDPRNHFHAMVNYTHIDNYNECSNDWVKEEKIRDVCFITILNQFEERLDKHLLNADVEWAKLAKKVFGNNLIIVK